MKKGFTLIELLATITILSIITLIVTPIILGVIDNGKKDAYKTTAEGILKSAELSLLDEIMIKEIEELIVDFETGENVKKIKIDGEIPKSGYIKVNDDGETEIVINNGKYCAKKYYNEKKITVENYDELTCN